MAVGEKFSNALFLKFSDYNEFIPSLCDNITQFGDFEDIVSLVTQTSSMSVGCHPLLISTLTRKFYITASEARGFHHIFMKNEKEMAIHLQEVKTALSSRHEPEKKNKNLFSGLSFRRKPPGGDNSNKTVTDSEKIPIGKGNPKKNTSSMDPKKTAPIPILSKKASGSRSSLTSPNNGGRKSSQEKRPIWKF